MFPVRESMKEVVGNSSYILVDKGHQRLSKGVFLFGVGDDARVLRLTPLKVSYRVQGLVAGKIINLPKEALEAMNCVGMVAGIMMLTDKDF